MPDHVVQQVQIDELISAIHNEYGALLRQAMDRAAGLSATLTATQRALADQQQINRALTEQLADHSHSDPT